MQLDKSAEVYERNDKIKGCIIDFTEYLRGLKEKSEAIIAIEHPLVTSNTESKLGIKFYNDGKEWVLGYSAVWASDLKPVKGWTILILASVEVQMAAIKNFSKLLKKIKKIELDKRDQFIEDADTTYNQFKLFMRTLPVHVKVKK